MDLAQTVRQVGPPSLTHGFLRDIAEQSPREPPSPLCPRPEGAALEARRVGPDSWDDSSGEDNSSLSSRKSPAQDYPTDALAEQARPKVGRVGFARDHCCRRPLKSGPVSALLAYFSMIADNCVSNIAHLQIARSWLKDGAMLTRAIGHTELVACLPKTRPQASQPPRQYGRDRPVTCAKRRQRLNTHPFARGSIFGGC